MPGPIITCSVIDMNGTTKALTGDNSVLVRHFSNAFATMTAEAQGGAAIDLDMYIIRNGAETIYGDHGTFYGVTSNAFTFSAEDSDGNVAQKSYIANMIDYIKLTCNLESGRPDGDGNMTLKCSGECFNGSFGLYTNTVEVDYRYKVRGGTWSSYNAMTVSKYGNTYTATVNITGLDYQSYYDFEVLAQDRLMTVGASASKVTSLPVFHWGESDVKFEVPVVFTQGTHGVTVPDIIEGEKRFTGNVRLKGDDNYGNKLLFGDGEYCYIGELSDDAMTIRATLLYLNTNSIKLNGQNASFAEYGEWTPELGCDCYYTNQKGWYNKTGNIVTVGFNIKATCYPTVDMDILVYGLPYTPSIPAAGGGVCSGAHVLLDRNFQSFVAETNGTISLRAQSCEGTNGTNLSTNKGALKYPSSAELTLIGTITFMTA